MVQLFAILIFSLAAVAGSTPANITSNLVANVEVDDNIETYQKANPDNQTITFDQLTKAVRLVTHTIGTRTLHDRLVARGSEKYSSLIPRNYRSTITYPRFGEIGQKVTFVEIKVYQSSTLGKATVIAGGIGKRKITILLEGYLTKRFDYTVTVYSSALRLQPVGLVVSLVLILFSFS